MSPDLEVLKQIFPILGVPGSRALLKNSSCAIGVPGSRDL